MLLLLIAVQFVFVLVVLDTVPRGTSVMGDSEEQVWEPLKIHFCGKTLRPACHC